MAKILYCFICKKPVDVHADEAIAVLCEDHKTKENMDIMSKNTPIKQLHAIQNEGLRLAMENTKDATKEDLANLYTALESIKKQIAALPTETTIIKEPAPDTSIQSGEVNEFGEVI